MQIALTFVIALMATTAQAGLLPNLSSAGGLLGGITKNLPVVGSVVATLPIDSTIATLPIVSDLNLDGVPSQGLGGVLGQVVVVVDQTLKTLLNGAADNVGGATNVLVNVADVADIAKVADIVKVPDVSKVANVV